MSRVRETLLASVSLALISLAAPVVVGIYDSNGAWC